MSRRLDGADFTLRSASDHGESGFHGAPFVVRIDFEVAEELLGGSFFVLAIERLQVGAGTEPDFGNRTGKFGSVAFAVGHGTGYGIDDNIFRAGIVFSAVGVFDVENVARELDERVLESAAGSE